MYKKDFIKQIIPDIIITIGIILFVIGIFNLIESDYPETDKVTVFGKENSSVLEEERELTFLEKAKEKNKDFTFQIDKIKPEQASIELDEESLMRLAKEPFKIEEYINKSKDLLKLNSNIIEDNRKDQEVQKEKNKIIKIIIPEGSSGRDVAKILDENKLLKYDEFIELLLLFDMEKRIKAGRYTFDSQTSFSDILSQILIKGR